MAEKLVALDGGWGWMCVLGSSLAHLLLSILIRSYGIFYLAFLEHFGSSATATSWVGAANMLAWGVCGPLGSALCRRFSCRTTTCAGALLLGATMIGTSYAPNLAVLAVCYTMAGVGMSLSYTPGYIIVGQYFDKKKATAMGLASAGAGLGSLAYPPLLLYLFQQYGYQGGMLITAGFLFNALVSGVLYRPLQSNRRPSSETGVEGDHRRMNEEQREGYSAKNGERPQEIEKKATLSLNADVEIKELSAEVDANFLRMDEETGSMLGDCDMRDNTSDIYKRYQKSTSEKCWTSITHHCHLFRDPKFLAIFLVNLGSVYGMQVIASFAPALAIDKGTEKFQAGFLLSIMGITDTVARLTVGIILDLKIIRPYRVLIFNVSAIFVGLSALCLPLFTAYGWFVFCMSVRGFTSGLVLSQRATICGDLVGTNMAGEAFGFVMVANAVGSVLGRVIGGIVKDNTGGYDYGFYLAGSVCILTVLVFLGVAYCHRRTATPAPPHTQVAGQPRA